MDSPNTQKQSFEGKYGKMCYGVSSMQGYRKTMEDAHIAKFDIAPNTHLFGVFDGHGGWETAEFVRRHFVDELLKCYAFQKGCYKEALKQTFLQMDKMLFSKEGKKELFDIAGAGIDIENIPGCTGCVALIVGNMLYVGNAGDSRCLLVENNQAIQITKDHVPTDPIENKRIKDAGSFVTRGRIGGRINMSRAIGDLEFKQNYTLPLEKQAMTSLPDVFERSLSSMSQMLIIGCDGVFDTATNKEVVTLLSEGIKGTGSMAKGIEYLLEKLVRGEVSGKLLMMFFLDSRWSKYR